MSLFHTLMILSITVCKSIMERDICMCFLYTLTSYPSDSQREYGALKGHFYVKVVTLLSIRFSMNEWMNERTNELENAFQTQTKLRMSV